MKVLKNTILLEEERRNQWGKLIPDNPFQILYLNTVSYVCKLGVSSTLSCSKQRQRG